MQKLLELRTVCMVVDGMGKINLCDCLYVFSVIYLSVCSR